MTDLSVPAPIVITQSAARKVNLLVAEEGNPAVKLRIYISGGGCAGFEYNFAFDDEVEADDTVIELQGATFVVDAMSLQMMVGAQIDYEEGLEGSRFVIRNPNASATCGCGSSFSV